MLLWRWRNDPAARAASLSSDEIPIENHRDWFARQLQRNDAAIYVVEDDSERGACGQVRLNALDEASAVVSIVIAAEHRGRGVGIAALCAVVSASRGFPWARRLFAVIRNDNQASRHIFESTGFQRLDEAAPIGLQSIPPEFGIWVLKP